MAQPRSEEVSWILFKTSCSKVWLWLKEHWQIPFLVVWSILIYVMTRRNTDAMMEVIEAKRESYRKQLEVLNETHNTEISRRDQIIEDYEKALEKIEEGFELKKKNLSEKQKEQIKKLIEKSKGNPDEIRKEIENQFGFKFHD